MASQSNLLQHVPSRAKDIQQILELAEQNHINNEMLIKVGLRMNSNLLFGSNQRCVAMFTAFKSIMDDINLNEEQVVAATAAATTTTTTTTHQTQLSQQPLESAQQEKPLGQLQKSLKQAMDFLDFCRPLSVSMTNGYKLIRAEILKLSTDSLYDNANFDEQRQRLKAFIDRFIDEEIWSAQRGICENISSNITTNDVILVYGCSTIVQHVLLHAKSLGKTFKVIIVDSPPHFNGRRMLRFLNDENIDATYTLINSLSFVMRLATKVLIGANSMLANGYVMSHIGTSQVALMAKATNVPTLVCCETYKLSDRVYVDSFGCNEVDSGHELGSALNLRYDLTPPEFISMVINEKSTVPAESVPALLRFRAERTRTYAQQVS